MASTPVRYEDAKVHLEVLGRSAVVEFRMPVGEIALADGLPAARHVSEAVSRLAVESVRAEGLEVSCRAGCGACCRQLVPISPIEAHHLAAVVEALPTERRATIEARFEHAVARMTELGIFDAEVPGRLRSTESDPSKRWNDVSFRYFEAGIPCPFLENASCSIYEERPLVCREYLVTTPAELCSKLGPDTRSVPRPIRMNEVMTGVGNAMLGRSDKEIPLISALAWSRKRGAAFEERVDGEALFYALTEQVDERSRKPFDDRPDDAP